MSKIRLFARDALAIPSLSDYIMRRHVEVTDHEAIGEHRC